MLNKQQRDAIRERAKACKVPWVSDVFRVVKTDIPSLLDTCDALEAELAAVRAERKEFAEKVLARLITGDGKPGEYTSVQEMHADLLRKHRDELDGRLDSALAVLRELQQWDMLDTVADGPYWKAAAAKVLGEITGDQT